jgi:hypothetical protein
MVMPRGLGRNTQQPLLTYKSSSQQQNQADFTKQLVDLGILSKAPDVRMTAQQRDQFTGGRQDTPQDFYRINMDNPIFRAGRTTYSDRIDPRTGEVEKDNLGRTIQDSEQERITGTMIDPIFGGSITPEGIAAALGTLPPSILQDRNLLTKRLGPLARFFMGARRFDTAGNFAGFEQPDPIGQPNFQAIRPAPRV